MPQIYGQKWFFSHQGKCVYHRAPIHLTVIKLTNLNFTWSIYLEERGSRCLSAPPTRWRLPVMRTWISAALQRGAALAMMLGLTGKTVLAGSANTESRPCVIHWRALRMQGNTRVSAFFSATRGRLSSMSSCAPLLFPRLLWRRQLPSLSKQRVSMFSTDTLKFCWSEREHNVRTD